MFNLPSIPNFDPPEEPVQQIVLKPANIVHTDGTAEKVYVQDLGTQHKEHQKHAVLHKRLTIIYLLVGTVALALSAYATVKMLSRHE